MSKLAPSRSPSQLAPSSSTPISNQKTMSSDLKKKQLVFNILGFLRDSVNDNSIKSDDAEGVEVASESFIVPSLLPSFSTPLALPHAVCFVELALLWRACELTFCIASYFLVQLNASPKRLESILPPSSSSSSSPLSRLRCFPSSTSISGLRRSPELRCVLYPLYSFHTIVEAQQTSMEDEGSDPRARLKLTLPFLLLPSTSLSSLPRFLFGLGSTVPRCCPSFYPSPYSRRFHCCSYCCCQGCC